eukprot:TRINITY_DN84646_c0_g1_i1.p2 TRINITY_DN84646_c0_g1~~TRINITY_DN84646_c0_g1_i1.p2  ORF type:complete len:160 (-),score=50.53 TRINITY_DN84646_c0_g1_i1:203-682(-)
MQSTVLGALLILAVLEVTAQGEDTSSQEELDRLRREEEKAGQALMKVWIGPDAACGEAYGNVADRPANVEQCQRCKGADAVLKVDMRFAEGLGLTYCAPKADVADVVEALAIALENAADSYTQSALKAWKSATTQRAEMQELLNDTQGTQPGAPNLVIP